MADESERSLGDDATFAGRPQRQRADVSLGDERTVGDGLSGQDTIIDGIEVVDLEARYKIEGTLGQGGMGAVLLATDTRLDRKVAIKRILGEAAGNRMAVNRFLTEAKSIAALNHPNIVQIYDYGRAKDGPFLIMEFVDGGSLLDRCRDGAMPLEEAIDLACQLCDGLAKAHDLGIIHRDIKPANVLLTKDVTPKLTDFGLAKAQASDHGQTMTGAVLGTPDFMPPEQRRDASLVDHRSDLWSLAATVYQMATGRSPKIIRFDLLPTELTKVLGKALEDAKDDRYQTARELRDALKASLRAAPPQSQTIAEGQCPSCGVQNEASRRFCRGCGGSLEAPCLSCDKPMPIGEEICGSCGAKQNPLEEARRAAMAAEQAKAEGLLGDFLFDEATRIATQLRDEPHSRLTHLKAWAEGFLGDIEKSRSHQVERAAEWLVEAHKHEEAHDYLSAIFSLESVPAAMRSTVLPGAHETVGKAIDRLKKTQAEVRRLESLVKERMATKSLDGLLVEVEQLLGLQPDRRDVQKLRAQLHERQARQAATRDTAIASAAALLDAHDYEAALSTLSALPPSARSVEFTHLHERARTLVEQVRRLSATIREAVAAKQFDELHATIDEYLQLKPADAEVLKLRQSLAARDEKIASEIKSRLQQAKTLEQTCRFAEAAKILEVIPLHRRDDVVTETLYRCQSTAAERSAALKTLAEARAEEYDVAMQAAGSYRQRLADAGLDDTEFNGAVHAAEAAQGEENRRRSWRRAVSIAIGSMLALLLLVCCGLWSRASQKASSVARALQSSRWDEALTLDPNNVAALVGRARARLAARPSDVDGAFAVLEQADRLSAGSSDVKAALGAAHAARATAHAKADRLGEAAQELAEASRLNGDAEAIASARAAIAAAWITRAEKAIDKNDATLVGSTCDSAMKAGASAEKVSELWLRLGSCAAINADATTVKVASDAATKCGTATEKVLALWRNYATACVGRLDRPGLTTACAEASKHGLTLPEVGTLWLRYGDEAVAKKDLAAAKAACDEALKADATQEAVRPLQVRTLVLEAQAMAAQGKADDAVALTLKAIDKDTFASMTVLGEADAGDLRQEVTKAYRKRFDSATAADDWNKAMTVSGEAARLDPDAGTWMAATLTPDRVRRLPATASAAIPAFVIASLPRLQNTVGMEFKLIPAGTFTMGEDDRKSQNATPHPVTLTKPFFIGVYEVTNAQWQAVMGSVPSKQTDAKHPVTKVSWNDAIDFCQKLSALPEEQAAARTYRLPTEAEWEYACRAGSTSRYSFGDSEEMLTEYGCYYKNSAGYTQQVGQKKPNPWGLHDVHGNVWEWCNDFYQPYPDEKATDPLGPARSFLGRVRRGGSASNPAGGSRSGLRSNHDPESRWDETGFRVVLSLPEADLTRLPPAEQTK